jgi:hypothetical protein
MPSIKTDVHLLQQMRKMEAQELETNFQSYKVLASGAEPRFQTQESKPGAFTYSTHQGCS